MAEDVVRLLDHLGIEKAHIVGYSLGGFTTLKLVTMHPERFLSATLGGAGWRPPGEDGGISGLAESLESGNGIAPLMIALTPAGQPPPSPEQIKMVNQMLMATNDPLALAAVIRGMGGLVGLRGRGAQDRGADAGGGRRDRPAAAPASTCSTRCCPSPRSRWWSCPARTT